MSTSTAFSPLAQRASFSDAGIGPGAFHMYADAETLDILQVNPINRLAVRIFQWDKPTVSYGYLLDTARVKEWTDSIDSRPWTIDEPLTIVKRPTGGGAVLHSTSDLSFSLVWRREQRFFPDRPRDCYAEIHDRLLNALRAQHETSMNLFAKQSGSCEAPREAGAIPVCFNEPVCNDVMQGATKVIGGALRITKNAILYQGNIQLPLVPLSHLKAAVRRAFA